MFYNAGFLISCGWAQWTDVIQPCDYTFLWGFIKQLTYSSVFLVYDNIRVKRFSPHISTSFECWLCRGAKKTISEHGGISTIELRFARFARCRWPNRAPPRQLIRGHSPLLLTEIPIISSPFLLFHIPWYYRQNPDLPAKHRTYIKIQRH